MNQTKKPKQTSQTTQTKKARQTKHQPGSAAAPAIQSPRRLETGVPRLDYILKGDLFTGATYVIMGPPGTGAPGYIGRLHSLYCR